MRWERGMSGLVAIVARDRGATTTEEEIESLAAAYESMRGKRARRQASAGDRVRVIGWSFGEGEAEAPPASAAESWLFTAGVAAGRGEAPQLDNVEGQFAWVSFDAGRNEVCVASDPFGMFTLYFCEREGKTYLATSALALAKHL